MATSQDDVANTFEANRSTQPDTWYVSYRSNIMRRHEASEHRTVRATQRFKTEAEAKKFAQNIIAEGWSAIAGTLNPHKPKKTIASTQILDWIAGKHVR
jgi:hypothetical protein